MKPTLSIIMPLVNTWEFNIRDSMILGIIGAAGLGLLISEAVSPFQWGRLATILLVVIALVVAFDALSRRIRFPNHSPCTRSTA